MHNEVEIAIQSALRAGEYLRRNFRNQQNTVKHKEDGSPVTECDLVSHQMINDCLQKAFPNHIIFSEESHGALLSSITKEPTWVIDPLDGTSNFIADIPLFAITIALVVNDETRIGLIYDPLHEDLFVATRGGGSVLNKQQIHVSNREVTKMGMLFAGRGYKKRDRDRHGQIILSLEKETTYFRRLGCAAIMLSCVAAGRADSVILTGNKPWDTVAGALLIEEAGGKVTDYCGNPWTYKSEDLLATNGIIHDSLIAMTCPVENNKSQISNDKIVAPSL
jgi:myo-inositol-1(or 4)-monophosphatase